MGIGVSIFMVALGAILAFAVSATVPDANLEMIGVILMIAGGVGLLISIALGASRRDGGVVEERVIERERPA